MKTFSTLLTTISKSGIESKVLYLIGTNKERLKRFLGGRWSQEPGRQEAEGEGGRRKAEGGRREEREREAGGGSGKPGGRREAGAGGGSQENLEQAIGDGEKTV
jgi:hypothetical protein